MGTSTEMFRAYRWIKGGAQGGGSEEADEDAVGSDEDSGDEKE